MVLHHFARSLRLVHTSMTFYIMNVVLGLIGAISELGLEVGV